jgi:hypothetical protein
MHCDIKIANVTTFNIINSKVFLPKLMKPNIEGILSTSLVKLTGEVQRRHSVRRGKYNFV